MNFLFASGSKGLIGNIIFLVLIVCLLVVFIRKNNKITTQNLILTSLFVVIPLVTSIVLSYSFYVGGVMVLKIGFHQQLMAIGGTLISPLLAVIAGIVFDVLGIIINPQGTPYLGFTFNYVACYLIGSLIFNTKKPISKHIVYGLLLGLGITTSVLLFFVNRIKLESLVINLQQVVFIVENRYLLIGLAWLIISLLGLVIVFSQKLLKNKIANELQINRWIVIVVCIEIVVNVLLTSLHLHAMLNIPILVLMIPRLVKAIMLLPIYIFVGGLILNYLQKIRGAQVA